MHKRKKQNGQTNRQKKEKERKVDVMHSTSEKDNTYKE